MNRIVLCVVLLLPLAQGCSQPAVPYGQENTLSLATTRPQVWAVAPAIDLSGKEMVDPILQADLLYQQLQQVRGLSVIPVNRVADVYASLNITRVQSPQQAAVVCELLGCDGLVVATVTAWDPYNPPKFGASLQLFAAGASAMPAGVDPRELIRQAAPQQDQPPPAGTGFRQAVGMYDAANGSVRDALFAYACGRNDPAGPMGPREYLMSMDRYCGFVYYTLIAELVR